MSFEVDEMILDATLGNDGYSANSAVLRAAARMRKRIAELQAEIATLKAGILKHRDTFPDEALEGEHELWKLVEDDK